MLSTKSRKAVTIKRAFQAEATVKPTPTCSSHRFVLGYSCALEVIVCVVLSVSDNPRALWVPSPCLVLFPGAIPMKAHLWSSLGCIQAVPQDIWKSQILKCPLFFHSIRFLHSPLQNFFPGNSTICETPATHPFRWLLHMSKPSGSLLACGYPRARAPLPLMVEKKLADCNEVMHIIWRMLKICWLSAAIYIQCRRLKKNTGWQSKIVMLMRQNLQHLKSPWALKHTKLSAKLALVPLCKDNIRRAPVLTSQAGSCMLKLDCCWSMGNNLEL